MSFTESKKAVLGLGLIALVAGCAHVGQDEFEGQIGDLRQMIQEGDRENAERTDALAARLNDAEARLEQLSSELNALSSEFEGMQIEMDGMEMAIRAHVPIHFGFDESEIPEGGAELLDRFATAVADYYPTAFLTVEGFTDPIGSEEYNLQLGQKRADAVRGRLVENGLDPERLRSVSYGEDTRRLMSDQGGPDGAGQENRRVVIVIDAVSPELGEAITDAQSGL